ncbi:MAG: TonB-dependent receptor, partial [Bacteroidota bacterium]
KIHLPSTKAGTFDIWGLGGLSEQKDDDSLFPETFGSNLGVAGLNHTIFLGKNTYLESGLVYSYQLLSSDEQDLVIQETFEDRFVNQTLRGRIQLNHKFNARLSLRTGLIGAYLSYNIFERFTNPIETTTTLDQDGQTSLWQAYAQAQYRLSPQLSLNLGVHALYFSLNASNSIEPRVGLQWKVGPKTSLSFGYGRHSRVESLSVYFARVQDGEGPESLPNQDLELAKADHYILAYDQFFGKHWHLKLEVYYQYLRDVPIARADRTSAFEQVFSTINLDNSFVNIPLVNEGTGENYGLELTLEKFFTKGWYFLMTNSLFDAEFTARDGIARDSRFNFDFATTFLG